VRASKGDRRRFTASYAISIVLHMVLIVLFLGTPGFEAGGSETQEQPVVSAVVTITHQQPPTLTITRAPRLATPAPVRAAPVRRQPPVAPVPAAAVPQTQREIAKIVKKAPVAAKSTPPPRSVAAVAPPAPSTPQPPTAPPTLVATAEPARVASSAPTVPPDTARIVARAETPAPTTEPTSPPTVTPRTPEPTAVPTRAPTAAPTPAPTRAPTAAPTLAPTAPPTIAPRVAATAAPSAQAIAARTPGPARSEAPARTAEAPAQRAAGAAAAKARAAATPAPVALAQPTSAPPGRNPVDLLNQQLKALTLNVLLPHSEVTYSQKHYGGDDIALLGQRIAQERQAKIAPPAGIVADIFGISRKRTTDTQPASVTYLYKRGIFGLCYGWYVIEHPLGGGHPEAGYTIQPCGAYEAVKPGSLAFPSASASPGPRPQATPTSRG
jgi:hypothetical protein